jgi:hypothetical protein
LRNNTKDILLGACGWKEILELKLEELLLVVDEAVDLLLGHREVDHALPCRHMNTSTTSEYHEGYTSEKESGANVCQ